MTKRLLTSILVCLLVLFNIHTDVKAVETNDNIYYLVSGGTLHLSSTQINGYYGFDSSTVADESSKIPWSTSVYTEVCIDNEIKPVSTAYWFANKDITYIDISNLNTEKLKNTSNMFLNCSKLTTIFTNNGKSFENVSESTNMFKGCTSLKGELNTIYNDSNVDKNYAKVTTSTQTGYLTSKLSMPGDVNLSNEGVLTFTSVPHADVYYYSINGNDWFAVTSGSNIKERITESSATKDIKVKSASINDNYSSSDPVTVPVNIKTVKFVTGDENNQFDYYRDNNVTKNSYTRAIKYYYDNTLNKRVETQYLTRTIQSEDSLISILLTGAIGTAYSYLEGYISAYFKISK